MILTELIDFNLILRSRLELAVSKFTTRTFLAMKSSWTSMFGNPIFRDLYVKVMLIIPVLFFYDCSYAGDCDIRFSVKGLKGGIKDFQVIWKPSCNDAASVGLLINKYVFD